MLFFHLFEPTNIFLKCIPDLSIHLFILGQFCGVVSGGMLEMLCWLSQEPYKNSCDMHCFHGFYRYVLLKPSLLRQRNVKMVADVLLG